MLGRYFVLLLNTVLYYAAEDVGVLLHYCIALQFALYCIYYARSLDYYIILRITAAVHCIAILLLLYCIAYRYVLGRQITAYYCVSRSRRVCITVRCRVAHCMYMLGRQRCTMYYYYYYVMQQALHCIALAQ